MSPKIPTDITDNDIANDIITSDISASQARGNNNSIDDKSTQPEIIRTSENRSLTSSLRRLITITFRRNGSTASKKSSRRLDKSANRNTNNNQNKRGIFISVARGETTKTRNDVVDTDLQSTSLKSSSDKNFSFKQKNMNNDNNNNDNTTTRNNDNNNKRRQFALGSLSLTTGASTNRPLFSRNSDASVQTDLISSLNKLKRDQAGRSSSGSDRDQFTRRSSQPPQLASPKPTASKTSITAISLGDAISLSKRNSQTFNNSEKTSIATNAKENNSHVTSQTQTPSTWKPTTSELLTTTSSSSNNKNNFTSPADYEGRDYIECPLCILPLIEATAPQLNGCKHQVCLDCMQRYIITEINHSRLNITCPMCPEAIHPNNIKEILQNEKYYLKYESFMLRRVLAAEPDARWCPAPDCGYVVLANGCASCPRLVCGRDGCKTAFCYHCKQEWHPNQTCSAASIQRNKRQLVNAYNISDLFEISYTSSNNQSPNGGAGGSSSNKKSSKSSQAANSSALKPDDIKECPVCASRIIKMNDGSCNHMTCSICLTEFCWLCMKEISDLHYFSPSGCTFWGKKPWSRKKKLLWQLGMLIGAPICIILIAGIAVPAIVIGIPVWAARKLHNRLERKPFSRRKKNAIMTGGVLLSFVVSPVISAVALAIGIPILLGYVYGVVPLSLCRSSGGCLSGAPSLEDIQNNLRNVNIMAGGGGGGAGSEIGRASARDGISIDTAMSHKFGGDPSIGETSIYLSNISLETNSIGRVTNVEREDRESGSNAGLAGSIISANTQANLSEDANSTRALAGSIMSKESGYTLVPAEVHAV